MQFIRSVTLGLLALLMVCLSGCGGNPGEEHRVNAIDARAILEDVLASWQQGETPESWRKKTPEVVVQDLEWKRGAKLKGFEIQGQGEAVDANLHCHVKLMLVDGQQQESERTVKYLVGTSPVRTVFREPGP